MAVGNVTGYTFDGLEPGESYYCELFYTRWSVMGKTYRIEFQALNRLSDYPLIGGVDRAWSVGEQMRLFLLNETEETVSVVWTVNGESCPGGSFLFEKAGSYKITAVVTYADGSKETLVKIMEVKNE